jgi:hypothetical protein
MVWGSAPFTTATTSVLRCVTPSGSRRCSTATSVPSTASLLFVWADLSYDEVATALGIPAGTVRSRIHRARRVLREQLADARRFLAPIEGGET